MAQTAEIAAVLVAALNVAVALVGGWAWWHGTTPGALWRAWRVAQLPSYKTHRLADPAAADSGAGGAPPGEMEPESLGPQAVAIEALLTALGVPVWGVPEHEADDVVASATSCATSVSRRSWAR